jgi:serine/threonine protein phosphatase PrpC
LGSTYRAGSVSQLLMDERLSRADGACPNCGTEEIERDAYFCQACGCNLDSKLIAPPPLLATREIGSVIAGRYTIKSLLWTAPTYNAYAIASTDQPANGLTLIDTALLEDSPAGIEEYLIGSVAGSDEAPTKEMQQKRPSRESGAADSKRHSAVSLIEEIRDGGARSLVFEEIQGQPIIHLDQTGEKETRAIGLQLCEIAEQLHHEGWCHNGFEPYNLIIDRSGGVRLLLSDRARRLGSSVEDGPVYPSRGYTAPELFESDAVYDPRMDIYSIGAIMQFLLTGERIEPGEESLFYPMATVVPGFERLLVRTLSEDPLSRHQTARQLHSALSDLSLPLVLQSGHFTDVGLVRELNEDSVLALNLIQYYESVQTQIGLYIVSDGMGGEAAGEVASRVTVRSIAEWVTDKLISASLKSTHDEKIAAPTQTGGLRLAIADGNDMATTEMLKMAVASANREVLAYAFANPTERGLGATATAAMVVGQVLTVAHVGDSRCYLLSGDRLEQLTEDHSLVQRMINTGNLSRTEARIHPYRNVIYRSIGGDAHIEIDIIRRRLNCGDVILLCSDGLNGMLSDDQIRDILIVNQDPNAAAKELVVNANAEGGEDNTSVIVVKIS